MTQTADEPLMFDVTQSAHPEHRSLRLTDRPIDRAVGRWQCVVFFVVAAGWTPLSLVAWLAVAIAAFGWKTDGSFGEPSIVAEPSGAAALSIVMGAVIFAIGAVVLVSLARWSIPHRRRASTFAAVVAICWAPVVATIWTMAG